MSPGPYKDPRSVEMAIKEAVRAMHAADPAVSVDERIRPAHFDRLLCRVFSQGAHSDWVLKGGTGMLARIPNTRATKDIDLFATGYTLDQALAALRQLGVMPTSRPSIQIERETSSRSLACSSLHPSPPLTN